MYDVEQSISPPVEIVGKMKRCFYLNCSYRLEIESEVDEAEETGRIDDVAEETEVVSSSTQSTNQKRGTNCRSCQSAESLWKCCPIR